MRRYILDFHYDGPKENFPSDEDPKCSIALSNAEKIAEDMIRKAGYEPRHEYSWTDGSLYKSVETDDTAETVRTKIRDAEKPLTNRKERRKQTAEVTNGVFQDPGPKTPLVYLRDVTESYGDMLAAEAHALVAKVIATGILPDDQLLRDLEAFKGSCERHFYHK